MLYFFGIPRGSFYPNEKGQGPTNVDTANNCKISHFFNCDYIKQINTNKY